MNGEVAPILWYLFWIGFVLISFGCMMFGGVLTHRARMKELEILRTYAEKGIDPPPGLGEPMAAANAHHGAKIVTAKVSTRATHLGQFFGSVFMTSVAGGILWWRLDDGGDPKWIVYAAGISAIVFGAGAFAQLVAAILAPPRD